MFPALSVTGMASLLRKPIARGEAISVSLSIAGDEGLQQIVVRVVSGTEHINHFVPVRVRLAKVKRATLDFDI